MTKNSAMLIHQLTGATSGKFNEIKDEMTKMIQQAGFKPRRVPFIPYSGFHGENLIKETDKMPWYKGWKANLNKETVIEGKTLYDALETGTEGLSSSDFHECQLEEFKLMARYLIFFTSAKELPTKGNLSKRIKEAMAESGSVENIKLYCFLTPRQLATLGSKSHLWVFCKY